jgi:hypothetical protein
MACVICKTPFYYDGFVCVLSSLIGNMSTASACPANYVPYNNVVTNRTQRCVCSINAGYYSSNSSCLPCSSQPPAGIPSSSCQACSLNSGFYNTSIECIYCFKAPYSTGTATVSGCKCIANYFWSAITSSCQCDWTIGYFGTPGSCVSCYKFPNTYSATRTGCTCVPGYLWNGTQCICDPTNGAFISASLQCINCNMMAGALPTVLGGNSCTCITGYIWSTTIGSCVCYYPNNNYLLKNGICYDCDAVTYSTVQIPNVDASLCACNSSYAISLSNSISRCLDCRTVLYSTNSTISGSCGCLNNFVWNSLTQSCTCPAPYTLSGGQCICNPTIAVVIGGVCFACSNDPYSSGVSNGVSCTCSLGMYWNGNMCSSTTCNSTSIYVLSSLNSLNYVCQDCTNPIYLTISKNSSNSCNCLSPILVWSSSTSSCQCSSSTAILYVSSNSYLCVTCNSSIYALSKLNSNTCSCIDSSFTWTGKSCSCSSGSIILSNTKCVPCSTQSTLDNFTCSCTSVSASSIWNDLIQKCITCGDMINVPFSVGGYYGVVCKCKSGYIWDVSSNACIKNCSGISCILRCNNLPNTVQGTSPLPVSMVAVRIIPGGDTIKNFYNSVPSNYVNLSTQACQCNPGYSWDTSRLRCFNNNISLS